MKSTTSSTESVVSQLSGSSVRWPEDPNNPHNWRRRKKFVTTIMYSVFTFNTLMSSTMVAPALVRITVDLHIDSYTKTPVILSVYVLSYAWGYFLLAPLSELYGRVRVLQLASTWFCVWNLVCGFAHDRATMIIARLFAGIGAAAALAIGSAVTAEVWRPEQRGMSLAVLSSLSLLGPTIGPLFGGVITNLSETSWRWIFWSTSAFCIVLQALSLFLLTETHGPTIRLELASSNNYSDTSLPPDRTMYTLLLALRTTMWRPFRLAWTHPILPILMIYLGVTFGSLYFLLFLMTDAFENTYGYSLLEASYNFASLGIGTVLATHLCGLCMDWLYRREQAQLEQQHDSRGSSVENTREETKPAPEIRLCLLLPSMVIMVAGLLLFGWCIDYRVHWTFSDLGIVLFGLGNQTSTQCTNAYLIDCFCSTRSLKQSTLSVPDSARITESRLRVGSLPTSSDNLEVNWSASAMASVWAAKSFGGFVSPLLAVQLVQALDYGWSFSIVALTVLALGIPTSIFLLCYGQRLRARGRRNLQV